MLCGTWDGMEQCLNELRAKCRLEARYFEAPNDLMTLEEGDYSVDLLLKK